MKIHDFEINLISEKDSDFLDKLSKNTSFKSYLKNNKEMKIDFTSFQYWLCTCKEKLVALILTRDVTQDAPDCMIPWIAQEEKTWWLTLISLEKEPLKVEKGSEILKAFLPLCSKKASALIVDPEVKQEESLALYTSMGFTRVSTFIKGQGFFKGTPHYLMKLNLS